jgi:hypothetical protein
MSWLFSQALVAEYSAANSWDGGLSVQLSVMPTQHKFWRNGRMMEFSKLSQFGLTCQVLTESRGAALLTWCLEAFPARISVSPERALDSAASAADFGQNSQGLLAKYDPSTHSLKTAQDSLFSDLTPSLVTLPGWGTMRNGVCYLRRTVVRRTSESVFGFSLPTQVASRATKRWATPTTMDSLPPKSEKALQREMGITRPGRSKPANLRDQVSNMRMWGTPKAQDSRHASWGCEKGNLGEQVAGQDGGKLNPTWVEWLMGWSLGWTDLKPLGMDKFLLWQRQHSICSE